MISKIVCIHQHSRIQTVASVGKTSISTLWYSNNSTTNSTVEEAAGAKKILEQQKEEARLQDIENKKNAEALKEKIEGITLEFVLKSGKDGKTFGSVSTKHIVEQLREKYYIRVDKRKFINAHPIGALGYSNLKVELY